MTVVRGAGAGEAVPALAGGWPLQGQELSELPFSVPGPSTPQEKGNRGAVRERQHVDSCLLSGFAKKREVAENSLRPLPAQGKVALKKQVPR